MIPKVVFFDHIDSWYLSTKGGEPKINKIDLLWNDMQRIRHKHESEAAFQRIAQCNEEMRELWSEYVLLTAPGSTIKCEVCSGLMYKQADIVYTSFPPKFLYICEECEHSVVR